MGEYSKQALKTSYRINNYIKSIIDRTNRDVRRKTGLDVSTGRVARTFWSALAEDASLRTRCLNCVCKKILNEEALNGHTSKKNKDK